MFYVGHGESAHLLPWDALGIMIGMILITMGSVCTPRFTRAVPATLVAIVAVTLIALGLKRAACMKHVRS